MPHALGETGLSSCRSVGALWERKPPEHPTRLNTPRPIGIKSTARMVMSGLDSDRVWSGDQCSPASRELVDSRGRRPIPGRGSSWVANFFSVAANFFAATAACFLLRSPS